MINMKNHFLSRILLALVFAFSLSAGSYGQLLLNENFDYGAGAALLDNGWFLTNSTTNPLMVTTGSLTYAGYPSSGVGNAVNMVNTGQDLNRPFTQQTSGTVYTGFLVSVSAAQTAGDYFFHFLQGGSTTILKGRVFIKKDPNSSNFAFGISKQLNTALDIVYTPFIYSLNTTYLLVMKYQIVSGTGNDQVALFVNPPTQAAEPGTPTISNTDLSQSDPSNIGAVGLRQGSSTAAATLRIDGIRVGLAWSDIVGTVPVPTLSEWGLILLGLALLGIGTTYIFRMKA